MILKILNDKHPSLKAQCIRVERPAEHYKFAMSMFTTMKALKAVGLAANQVGKHLRIITIDTPDFSGIMFNPQLYYWDDRILPFPEGCLSIKGVQHNTNTRFNRVDVSWQDKDGNNHGGSFTGLTAVVLQHEIDHLNGILMTDYKNINNTLEIK